MGRTSGQKTKLGHNQSGIWSVVARLEARLEKIKCSRNRLGDASLPDDDAERMLRFKNVVCNQTLSMTREPETQMLPVTSQTAYDFFFVSISIYFLY